MLSLKLQKRLAGLKPKPKLKLVPKKASSKSALDYALQYAKREGIPGIWIPQGSKAPVERGWPEKASTDLKVLREWSKEHPNCNFGLVMGNGFVAIDLDDPAMFMRLKEQGYALPPTRVHKTPRGFHFIYRVPPDMVLKNKTSLFPGVDVRGDGGQIVSPGSVNSNGDIYGVEEDSQIADLPTCWLNLLTEGKPRAAAKGAISEGRRNSTLTSIAGTLRKAGKTPEEIEAALLAQNREKCSPPLADDEVGTIAKSARSWPVPDNVAALLNDTERTRIMLPADDRLLGEFAAELGAQMRGLLYRHGRDVVTVEGGVMRAISAQELRTLAERRVICCRQRTSRGGPVEVRITMTAEESRGAVASPQFLEALTPIKCVASCREPVMRADGSIELLPVGYDAESQTMTLTSSEYRDDMPFDEAVTVLRDLFSEFEFADAGRSLAVAVSALVGLYAQQLLPSGALRPAFVYTKNGEGAGATTAAACAIVPVLGDLPTGSQPSDPEEMRKLLTSSLREGRRVVLLDNIKTVIGGPALEAFCSAATWSDRILGANDLMTMENNIIVFGTGNGSTMTPDMRRRSLVCELHLSVERAEDRQYKRVLNVAVLKKMRPEILASCWALVRSWDEQGRPQPSRSHSAFPEWAATIGGIVEHAGFGCALATPETMFAPDEDGDNMRSLVAAMKSGRRYNAAELYALCRANQIFTNLVGLHENAMDKSQLSAMGRLLTRYHNRLVGASRFLIEGVGHRRRFYTEKGSRDQHGRMVEHGVSPELLKTPVFDSKGKHHADHADHATTPRQSAGKIRKYAARRRAN
ncbi:MAG TPA: bifunctional DNA primase/polymerase [Terracidiphilus sp.]|nr:bifunctional DNA primase/polymerase [Terracidiphilus sp.]